MFLGANELVSLEITLTKLFSKRLVQAIDFLEKCLTFSPKRRITVVEALQHPYFEVCIHTVR